jgi:hypothetical protein
MRRVRCPISSVPSIPWFGRGLAVLFALAVAPAAWGQEYKIKLHRPEKVGDTYTISAAGDSKSVLTIDAPGGPKKQEAAFTAKAAGTVRVLAVSESGLATKLSLTVEQCLRDDKPLFDKGTVINVENAKGKKLYTVNGEPISPEAAEALALLVQAHRTEQQDLDTSFGTTDPQKVGSTWPVNAPAAAADLGKGGGLEMQPEDVTGTVKLAAVKQMGGKEALQVDMDVHLANAHGGLPGSPQKIDHGDYDYHVSGLFPTDPNAKMLSQDLSMKARFHATVQTPGGKEVSLNVTAEQNAKITFGEAK